MNSFWIGVIVAVGALQLINFFTVLIIENCSRTSSTVEDFAVYFNSGLICLIVFFPKIISNFIKKFFYYYGFGIDDKTFIIVKNCYSKKVFDKDYLSFLDHANKKSLKEWKKRFSDAKITKCKGYYIVQK